MSSFQDSWLQEKGFSLWLAKVDDVHSAKCKLCVKTISVESMGVKALEAHARGEKHRQRQPCNVSRKTIAIQFAKQNEIQTESSSDRQSKFNKRQQMLFATTENKLAKHTEMMLAVELVMCKQSFRSCDNKSSLFSAMFPNSFIAKSFACAHTKCRYIVCFGIDPYLRRC